MIAKEHEPLLGLRVLVLEDDEDTRELYGFALRMAGADVTTTSSAYEAFAVFEQTRPDAIVADLGRADQHVGAALVEWVRALAPDEGGETPAVAVTGHVRPQDRARALGAGFDVYLSKPVEPAELVDVLRRVADSCLDTG